MTTLDAIVAASLVWMATGLAASAIAARRRGTTRVPGTAVAPAWPGVVYAFGRGMSPRAKESATQHPWIYAAGVAYHLGIALAVIVVWFLMLRLLPPRSLSGFMSVVLLVSAGCGIALLGRRATSPLLRAISAPDDYASNLLVDLWLVTAALAMTSMVFAPAFLVVTALLAFYVPLGKIRHCLFFFLARGEFGARLGHRGIVRSTHHERRRS